jgi:hypothetical protein
MEEQGEAEGCIAGGMCQTGTNKDKQRQTGTRRAGEAEGDQEGLHRTKHGSGPIDA